MNRYLAPAVADIRAGVVAWPIWTLLAWNDIRKRYRRSKIGQFWLTLSMAVTILGMGYVYSTLFNTDISKFIPYVSVTFVMWGFISGMITEGCMTFIENETIIRYTYLPRSTFVFRLLFRNLTVAAHNIVIVVGVFLYFGVAVNWNILWLIPGLALVILNCFWAAFVLGMVCARYRDVPQIILSVVQIAFFITPVMFLPSQLSGRAEFLLHWNPFAALLEVVRDPLLGQAPSLWALGACCLMLLVGVVIMLPFLRRYGPRVVFWL